jgi:hypothetical protein
MNKVEHEYSCLIYVCTCENTELDDLKAENDKLKETVEMLHTDSLQNYRETLEAYQAYIKSLRAENARLREVLIELSHSEVIKNDPESYEIAREALRKFE